MVPINYISNLDVNEYSGGWSGMNHHVHRQLLPKFNVHLVDKINTPYSVVAKAMSKALRSAGLKGGFPAFSNERLLRIGKLVEKRRRQDVSLDFYHGSTPWLYSKSKVPYAAYLDASFATYITVYHKKGDFNSRQIDALFAMESEFLQSAAAVFFSSSWARQDTCSSYGISSKNFHVAGLGGAWEQELSADGHGHPYIFVGLDFMGRGSDTVVETFTELVKEFPGFHLKIVATRKYLTSPFIVYEGFIDKKQPGGQRRLYDLFANAHCVVLPTTRDITPLVLVEAGSVGCPAIATNSFGIPEIVKHNVTGILISFDEGLKSQLANAKKMIISDIEIRERMKTESVNHTGRNFTWKRTGTIICDTLSALIT